MDQSEIASLKADLRRMQARVDELETAGEEPTNRRNMLRGLGVAAAGAAVGGLAFARPVGATDGVGLIIGTPGQTAQSNTSLVASGYTKDTNVGMFHLTDDASQSNIATIGTIFTIIANNNAGFTNGAAISATNQALKLSAPVPLKMNDTAAPVQTVGTRGMFMQENGALWFCVASSGSQRWRRITGPTGAGGFNALAPFRAYDSRKVNPVGNVGILTSGSNRTIPIQNKLDPVNGLIIQNDVVPAGATAIVANVTITGTTGGSGFLSINPGPSGTPAGANTSQATSAINWFGADQNLANSLTLTLDNNRQVTVVCGSSAGDTHFIIDVAGYYL